MFSDVTGPFRPLVAFPGLGQRVSTAMPYSIQRKWEAIELSFDECIDVKDKHAHAESYAPNGLQCERGD